MSVKTIGIYASLCLAAIAVYFGFAYSFGLAAGTNPEILDSWLWAWAGTASIALAVTLGLADVKARRAGVQLGMLFIDEPPFLDADGTDAYADALLNMATRNPNMRILAISHDPTMKARFNQNIVVTAGEDGSVVAME